MIRARIRVAVWAIALVVGFALQAVLRSRLAAHDPIGAMITGEAGSTVLLLAVTLFVRLFMIFVVPGWGILVVGSVLWDAIRSPGQDLGDPDRPVRRVVEGAADERPR